MWKLFNPLKTFSYFLDPNKDLEVKIYGRSLICLYEGLGPNLVRDPKTKKVLRIYPYICPAGKFTLGYGRVISGEQYRKYKIEGITLEQAEANFIVDLKVKSDEVKKLLKVAVTDYQFDAMVSLAYNVGIANFKSSTLLKKVNKKDFLGASKEFGKWIYANKKRLQGLVNRREAERRMFVNDPPRPRSAVKNASKNYMLFMLKP